VWPHQTVLLDRLARHEPGKDCVRDQRKQLVGLKPIDPTKWLPEGAQLVFNTKQAIPMSMVGHVTSSYAHNSLGYSFALAVVKGGPQASGERVFAPLADGSVIEAESFLRCSSIRKAIARTFDALIVPRSAWACIP